MKEKAAAEIVKRVRDGETLGIGTGSTIDLAIEQLAARVHREKLKVRIVPSSYETAWSCSKAGLEVLSPHSVVAIDWGFDGADEVSPELWLIKGRGGAMLKEKILASRCKKFVAVVDESKIVTRLGEKFAIPVELVPESLAIVERGLGKLGASHIELREGGKKHGPVVTEAGNIIVDATFPSIGAGLERDIKAIVGVVESGLFIGYAAEAVVAGSKGVTSLFPR